MDTPNASLLRRLILVCLSVVLLVPLAHGKRSKKRGQEANYAREESEQVVDFGGLRAPGLQRWLMAFLERDDKRYAGQLKITRVDTSHTPRLDVYLSILEPDTELLTLQPLADAERLQRLELLMASGEKSKVQPFLAYDVAADESLEGPPAKLIPMDKAEAPLDVVIVAAGHSGYRDVQQLESEHKSAILSVMRRLKSARINIIWHGPMLYTYRSFEGITGEMSRFDESQAQCDTDYVRYRRKMAEERDEAEEPPAEPPCGLHQGLETEIKRALHRRSFRGKHSRLFGIDRESLGLKPCTEIGYNSTALRHLDLDTLEQRTGDYGAFEEALRLLVRYSQPGHRRAIIVIGDGRDGYLEDDSSCREYYATRDRQCSEQGANLRGKARKEQITACVQRKMDERASRVQEAFAKRAQGWLALARAAEVKVHAITYAMRRADGSVLSHEWERERLELLAHKTGGTYREVVKPRDASEVAATLGMELTQGFVLRLDAGLLSKTPYKMQLKATIADAVEPTKGKALVSQKVSFTSPFIGEGFEYWLRAKNDWLKSKVGPIVYWVILIAAALVLLLLVWLAFKLVKALVMKLVGIVVKKGKGAATSASKGGRGS